MPDVPPFDVTFLTRPQARGGGDYLHRTLWPGAALGEHLPTTAIQLSHPDCLDAMANTRLLVVTMVMDIDMRRVFDERRARGLPTIYEISDDFEAFPDNLPLCKFYAQPWVRELARELCRKADAVQFSSPRLARKYGALNPMHRVFHNQAWEVPSAPRPLETLGSSPLHVGWAGMAGHYEDCADLVKFLRPSFGNSPDAFAPARADLRLMTTPRIAETLSNAGVRFSWQPTGSMADYGRFLDSLDVGIAHSSKRDFALARTDGKFIEYATHGVVPVCCNRGTYSETIRHGDNGLLYTSPTGLRAELERLIESPEARQRVNEQAHAELGRHRNHRAAAPERLEFYSEVEELAHRRRPNAPRTRSRLAPAHGFIHAVHDIEEDLQAAYMKHRDAPSPELLQTYWALAQRQPEFFRIWDALLKVYGQLGLTENLVPLQRRAELSKSMAFERAFGAAGA